MKIFADKNQRFSPLDIFRGLLVIGLFIYVSLGTDNRWDFLIHGVWNEMSFIDIGFPMFVVCMCISLYYSLKKYKSFTWPLVGKIALRTVLLIFLGLFFNFISGIFTHMDAGGFGDILLASLKVIRFYGPLQRLALVYLFVTLIIMSFKSKPKFVPLIIGGGLLFCYFFILGFGHGYEFSTQNVIYIVDNAIIPPEHLYELTYNGQTLTIDPEGLISTIPCIAQGLLSYGLFAYYIEYKDREYATLATLVIGCLTVGLGLFCSLFSPLCKNTWSPSYTLLTTGISFILLMILAFATLKKPHEKVFYVFTVAGSNAIVGYVLGPSLFNIIKAIPIAGHSIQDYMNIGLTTICFGNAYLACFLVALIFAGIDWLILWLLYRKKLFIRL